MILIFVATSDFTAPDRRGYPHHIFLISPCKHMFWVLVRSALVSHFLSNHNICFCGEIRKISGPSCSKLTMSLVNLLFKYGIYANIFAEKNVLRKSYSHFFSKNTCELDIVLTKTLNILTINKLVQLTML